MEFYRRTIGAEVIGLLRWKESPDKAMKSRPGFEEKVMNATFRIGETELTADDSMGEKQTEFKGMSPAIEVGAEAEAKRAYAALGEGGMVTMALAETFWSFSLGMLSDKFDVPWMVNVATPKG